MGRRAGTENVAYIVGLGVACDIAKNALPAFSGRVKTLRDIIFTKTCWRELVVSV